VTDRSIVLIVVLFIGVFAIGVLAVVTALIFHGDTVPDPIWTLGGGALGALGTLLASTKTNPAPPENPPPAPPAPPEG
jgi:hypothetical protein